MAWEMGCCSAFGHRGDINFVAKFLQFLVRNEGVARLKAIIKSVGRAVIVAALVARSRDRLCRIFLARYREGIGTSTTYPFPCLIFRLCEDSQVPSALWRG
ncbi:hypothetical protein H5410_064047 [Solanum commersonii]|uniref:Uncharacterized protein n=1 Tax=Solanum commersonii TaxID=4109 RepID=A0A9J5W0P5_SOLCO|nr:hypothetical protein H5410_064047 [Solanum commersonii]